MKRQAPSSRGVWVAVLLVEALIAQAFVWNCFLTGSCRTEQCVPTGSSLSQTCILVGLKVFIPMLIATGVVAFVMKTDRRS